MAEGEILTKHQVEFLDFVSTKSYITQCFYLTGGTALAAFYLHHHISEDLDFFNEREEVNLLLIKSILGEFKKKRRVLNCSKKY